MAEPLVNQEYLGRCYDIVTLDPLDLASSAKYVNAVDMDIADADIAEVNNRKILVPPGVNPPKAIYSMSWESQSRLISSSYELQQEFKVAVEADAGVDGAFEFSGSASTRQVDNLSETRKHTSVYSRAYQQNHGLELNLRDPQAPIRLTEGFARAVRSLPVGEFSTVRGAYDEFLKTFGTHFTTEIILGGMAFQRTTGLASTWLSSREKQEELKAKASVEVEAFKAGASTELARSQASKVDNESNLERTQLEFRGGTGSPTGINDDWIASLDEKPAVVRAKLEKLTLLLTDRFFPDLADIEDRRALLECAIYTWVKTKGTPSCDKQPLQYGERFALCFGWRGQAMPTPARLWMGDSPQKTSVAVPRPDQNPAAPLLFVVLERATGRDGGIVLAGDSVRVRVAGTNLMLDHGGRGLFSQASSGDATFTIHHFGDDPARPSRLGEYFVERDTIQLTPATPQRASWRVYFNPLQGGNLQTGAITRGSPNEEGSALHLRRPGVDAPDVE